MGETSGTGGPAVTETRDPEQLRQVIDETRDELGATVEALAAKTNVKARVRRKLDDAKAAATRKTGALADGARTVLPSKAGDAPSRLARQIRRNPLPAVAGALITGVIIGRILRR